MASFNVEDFGTRSAGGPQLGDEIKPAFEEFAR